mgnify:CR=1 FL=1
MSIPTSLYKEVKLNGGTLIGIDVDNAIWQWGINEPEDSRILRPIITLESEDPAPSKIKEVFVEPTTDTIIVLAVDNRQRP